MLEDSILRAATNAMPRFNDDMLRGWTRKQIDRSPELIEEVFKEAVKRLRGRVTYKEHHVLLPEERAAWEIAEAKNYSGRGINPQLSELKLVEYRFLADGVLYTTHLYLPYMAPNIDMIVINGRRFAIQREIAEQTFTPIPDGILMRVIQGPVSFYRRRFRLEAQGSDTDSFNETVIAAPTLFRRKRRGTRAREATVVHYLIVKYGFYGAMLKLRLDPEAVTFATSRPVDDRDHAYYIARRQSKRNTSEVFVRVRRDALESLEMRRFVAGAVYVLTHFTVDAPPDIYARELAAPDATRWKQMLGHILFGDNETPARAINQADAHMFSNDIFLDPITQRRFLAFGVNVENIYDVLAYVFHRIDEIRTVTLPQDLYNKRIDVTEGVLIQTVVAMIFHRFYKAERSSPESLQARDITQLLRLKTRKIEEIGKSPQVIGQPDVYSGNWLPIGISKVRASGRRAGRRTNRMAQEWRFHPSIAVVETLAAFSGTPGVSGSINPYLVIDEMGGIVRPPYADDVDEIRKYLAY